jgi:hypothetical protein
LASAKLFWAQRPFFPAVFHVAAQNGVHSSLEPRALAFEPLQHVSVQTGMGGLVFHFQNLFNRLAHDAFFIALFHAFYKKSL